MPRSTPFVLVLVAVALAACSPDAPAATAPSTAPGPSPLSLDEFRKDPCTGLTADQAAEFDLAPGKSISDVGYGASCMWSVPAHESNVVMIGLDSLGGGGIDHVLGNRANHAYHDEVEIEGRPAVFASADDLRPEGTCTLWVGVPDLLVRVTAALPEGPDAADPCPPAQRIATAVVRNLGSA